jgi:simple sugar transport system permease protein
VGSTRVNWGIAVCAAAGLAYWILLRYTRLGFELKASGENPRAARYARLPYNGLVVFVLAAGGALSGLAGFVDTSANLNRLQTTVMAGYGYTAIVVAWLARLNPLYIAIASYLLAGLRAGVEVLQLEMQVPSPFAQIMEGLILLSVLAGSFFSSYRLELRSKA